MCKYNLSSQERTLKCNNKTGVYTRIAELLEYYNQQVGTDQTDNYRTQKITLPKTSFVLELVEQLANSSLAGDHHRPSHVSAGIK